MYVELFLILVLAHVLGDFYFQSEKMCSSKRNGHVSSPWMYCHSLIVTVITFTLVWDSSFLLCAGIIFVSHWLIDVVKSYRKDTALWFIIDQLLHIAVLVAICCLWSRRFAWTTWNGLQINDCFMPEYILAILLLGKPTNILIKKILSEHKLHENGTNRIGSLIGSLERCIAFLLIVAGQFSAVGFLVTAKSVLRFKDTQTEKTEYVLAGTLLSFGMAIAVGMTVEFGLVWIIGM